MSRPRYCLGGYTHLLACAGCHGQLNADARKVYERGWYAGAAEMRRKIGAANPRCVLAAVSIPVSG